MKILGRVVGRYHFACVKKIECVSSRNETAANMISLGGGNGIGVFEVAEEVKVSVNGVE